MDEEPTQPILLPAPREVIKHPWESNGKKNSFHPAQGHYYWVLGSEQSPQPHRGTFMAGPYFRANWTHPSLCLQKAGSSLVSLERAVLLGCDWGGGAEWPDFADEQSRRKLTSLLLKLRTRRSDDKFLEVSQLISFWRRGVFMGDIFILVYKYHFPPNSVSNASEWALSVRPGPSPWSWVVLGSYLPIFPWL